MRLFQRFFKLSQSQRQPQQGFDQTFILEPILTPSGLVDIDGGDDGIDIGGSDIDLPNIADIDLPDPLIDDADIEPVDFFDGDGDLDILPIDNLSDKISVFEQGVFTVGDSGEVSVDFLFDGGGYQGELAIFNLEGMDGFDFDNPDDFHNFLLEASQRALSDSEMGHVVISDLTEGARFSGTLPEGNFNSGDYQGVTTVQMNPGDNFAVMLVPNGSVQRINDLLEAGEDLPFKFQPLFSLSTANPDDAFHIGQIADVTGDGNTFALEDLRTDGWTDQDYNDIVFQVRGATGEAVDLDEVVNPNNDWRGTDIGQELIEYAEASVIPDVPDLEFPTEDQPLVGIIDTGVAIDNPDIDYSDVILGTDRVDGDNNPLLQSGEGNEHGTHVLGIIGATQDNGVGIDGINDDAPLWVGRAIGSGQWAESLVEFVDAAQESGQPNAVVNLSLDLTQVNPDGTTTTRYEFTPFEREAIEYARQNGVLIVASSGNDGSVMSVLGQASQEFDNIITVGAADGLERAEYSSYGNGLDILAEGGTKEQPILSTAGDNLGFMAGTSVATAKVTGAASLVWAANPELSYRQVVDILTSTATDLNVPGWDAETGSGLLNIPAAVELAKTTQPEVYNPEPWVAPDTWSGEGKVTPEERPTPPSTPGPVFTPLPNPGIPTDPGQFIKTVVSNGVTLNYYANGYWMVQPNGSKTWYALGTGTPSGNFNLQPFPFGLVGTDQDAPWVVRFWDNKHLAGAPKWTRLDPPGKIAFNAGLGVPQNTKGVPADNFSARWETTTHFDGGFYNFVSNADDGIRVYIDGVLVNNKWAASNPWERHDVYVAIPEGKHHVRVDYFEEGGVAGLNFGWEPTGLLPDYAGALLPVGFDGAAVHGTYVYTYQRNGGIEQLGYPTNNVHPWEDGYLQDFEGGAKGRGAIMKSNANDNSYWVGGKIWEKFLELRGASYVGYPNTDLIPVRGGLDNSGGSVQHFRGGRDGLPMKLWQSQHGVYATWGAIGGKYDQMGGPSSWLGFPTSDEMGIGDGWVRQNFEGGYILWHPQYGATAYDTKAIDTLPPDSGNSSTENWHAQYWNNPALVGSPQWSQYEEMSDLRFHAGQGAPVGTHGIPEDNFAGRWITTSYFDGGIYNFINNADDGVRVYVNGQLIIDKWTDSPFEEKRAYASIEPGYHQVMVEYFEHEVSAANLLRWEPINTPQDWSGEVFNNISLEGSPEGHLTEDSTFLNGDWGLGSAANLLVPPDRWGQLPGQANDISVGADGSVWKIGATSVAGGYSIHQWTGNSWKTIDGGATQVAVAPDGTPWVLSEQGYIFKRVGDQWQTVPGKAKDISIGADGSVWVIGDTPINGGYRIYRWDGQNWQEVNGGATRITVAPDGTPWVVNNQGNIYKRVGNQWQLLPGRAKDIEIGADGSVWAIGDTPIDGGYRIYRWDGQLWQEVSGGATRVTVAPDGTPWVVNNQGNIYVRGSDATNEDYFSDRWATTRYFDEPGVYEFTSQSDDGVRVWIDDKLVIDQWNDHALTTNKVLVPLDEGYHRIRVEHYENKGSAANKLSWTKKANGAQPWTAEYFNNPDLQGAPVATRLETANGSAGGFERNWGTGRPDFRIASDNFSSRLNSHRYFPAGTYKFTLQGDDGMRFYINGENIVDRWTNPPFAPHEVEVTLPEGVHNLTVEHSEKGGLAYANLDWSLVPNAATYSIAPEFQPAHANFENQLGNGAVGVPVSDVQDDWYWQAPPPGHFGTMDVQSVRFQEFRGTEGRGALLQMNGGQVVRVSGKLWEAYQNAGGLRGLGMPKSSEQDLGNGAVELELPNGRLFWSPGMTNATYYEYAEATPKTLTIPADAWRGEYFDNRDWAGDPLVVRQDSTSGANLYEFWDVLESPAPGLPDDDFSVRWTSQRPFDRGTYRFISGHDDGFTVEVNGQKPIDKMIEVATQTTGYAGFAVAGQYGVKVLHREYGGAATAQLRMEKASDFVVGLDGNNFSRQAMVDAFLQGGGYDRFGFPTGDVRPWGNGVVQEFDTPYGKHFLMLENGSNTAYWVFGDNLREYLEMGGATGVLGYPRSNENLINRPDGRHAVWQAFAGADGKARIHHLGRSVATWGAIGSRYTDLGGAFHWLGMPTRREYDDGDTIFSDFEGGRIAYNRNDGRIEELRPGQEPSWRQIVPPPSSSWQHPLPGYPVTSEYGWRRLRGKPNFHHGIDIGAPTGTTVSAAKPGTVVEVGNHPNGWGNFVRINHDGFQTIYAHLSSMNVSKGQTVGSGSAIGRVGNTGNSTGSHLHFEVRVAPYRWKTDNRNPRNYINF